MCKIFCYGEDSLTFWALNKHLDLILKKLEDKSCLQQCITFYRPSFGRHGGESCSNFGEFDAILSSSEYIYLIESKWDSCGKRNNTKINLSENQKLRPEIFKWYFDNWTFRNTEWKDFCRQNEQQFKAKFNKPIAREGTLLSENLSFVIKKLKQNCEAGKIKNILLYFHQNQEKLPEINNTDFKIIYFDYTDDIDGNFVISD